MFFEQLELGDKFTTKDGREWIVREWGDIELEFDADEFDIPMALIKVKHIFAVYEYDPQRSGFYKTWSYWIDDEKESNSDLNIVKITKKPVPQSFLYATITPYISGWAKTSQATTSCSYDPTIHNLRYTYEKGKLVNVELIDLIKE